MNESFVESLYHSLAISQMCVYNTLQFLQTHDLPLPEKHILYDFILRAENVKWKERYLELKTEHENLVRILTANVDACLEVINRP